MLSFKYHVSLQRFEITHSALEAVKISSTMAHAHYNALIVTFSQGHHNMNCQWENLWPLKPTNLFFRVESLFWHENSIYSLSDPMQIIVLTAFINAVGSFS